ncbi:hypothetical protein [Luteitalea sp. TBR-22]|uniref:hypothetical protein n=1 Tax=Luteitalea sp. TBR-22 TaxID=2802971 RepID=UPI001EF3E13B|nr:hypothetical protein [Luteitalea sp. TBR-22]
MSTPLVASVLALGLTCAPPARAAVIYEHLPEANSRFISHHNAWGPVLADDFDPARSGKVLEAEWWGSMATSPLWELTLHRGHLSGGPGSSGEPIPDPAFFVKTFVNATGEDPDGDGVYYYRTSLPGTFAVNAGPRPFGSEYWFSIANADDEWTWAMAGAGPTVGDEHWYAVQSTASPLPVCEGGPHCGPWTPLAGHDFAYRLSVPEPSMLTLGGLSLILSGLKLRRRTRR